MNVLTFASVSTIAWRLSGISGNFILSPLYQYIHMVSQGTLLATKELRGRLCVFFLVYQVTADAFQVSEIEKAYSCRRKPGSDKCLLCSLVDGCILSGSIFSHPEI